MGDLATCKAELDKCMGAVMIAYPAYHRLPWYVPTRMECENKEELDGRSEMQDILDGADSSIWWAGKELQTDKICTSTSVRMRRRSSCAVFSPRTAGLRCANLAS